MHGPRASENSGAEIHKNFLICAFKTSPSLDDSPTNHFPSLTFQTQNVQDRDAELRFREVPCWMVVARENQSVKNRHKEYKACASGARK